MFVGAMRRVLGVALSIVALAYPAFAQGRVMGRVITRDSAPVANAVVELTRARDSTRTSETGAFVFRRQTLRDEVLRVRALGFAPDSLYIGSVSDSGWYGTIVLEAIPRELPEVQVTAEAKPAAFAYTTRYDPYFRRRRMALGSYRTYEDIERRGDADITSALQGIPGLSISLTITPLGVPDARIRIARCPGNPPRLAIYLNGARVSLTREGEAVAAWLQSVPVRDILFIEFYRGASEIPSDLERGDNCAVLVIWTR